MFWHRTGGLILHLPRSDGSILRRKVATAVTLGADAIVTADVRMRAVAAALTKLTIVP